MNAEFYLFDVDHGQCAALKLPSGKWCLFDLGSSLKFSPIKWIIANANSFNGNLKNLADIVNEIMFFKFYKVTVSHFHGDHLADWKNLIDHDPEYFRMVVPDKSYLDDCKISNTNLTWPEVNDFIDYVLSNYNGSYIPDYGDVSINELQLPVEIARSLGGDASARVNNASVVTRIDIYGHSILICGDLLKEAWEAIIKDQNKYGPLWKPYLSSIDILVAPHHGHRTGYSIDLLNIAKPSVVLISVKSKDPNVDSRYSMTPVKGIKINGEKYSYISTRQKGHIKITFEKPLFIGEKGKRSWIFGYKTIQ